MDPEIGYALVRDVIVVTEELISDTFFRRGTILIIRLLPSAPITKSDTI